MTASVAIPQPRLRARHPRLDFSATPKYWVHGDPQSTHVLNLLHFAFPVAERAFVDGVRLALPWIRDPQVLDAARGFIGQESTHARLHDQAADQLNLYDARFIRRVVDLADGGRIRFERTMRRLPDPVRRRVLILVMSAIATAEHAATNLADIYLTDPRLDHALIDPEIDGLLSWHSAEELEHRSVAFDVYREIGGGYLTRVLPMALGLVTLPVVIVAAASAVMMADRDLRRPFSVRRHLRAVRAGRMVSVRPWAARMPEYFRRDFHPSSLPDEHALAYLAANGDRFPAKAGSARERAAASKALEE